MADITRRTLLKASGSAVVIASLGVGLGTLSTAHATEPLAATENVRLAIEHAGFI